MSTKTININGLSNYDYIVVGAITSGTKYYGISKYSGSKLIGISDFTYFRCCKASSDSIEVDYAYNKHGERLNNALIPRKIYGIKGTLF